MQKIMWIAIGGGAGSVARYLVDGWVQRAAGAGFPYGTMAVNAIGSFLIGVIMQAALATGQMNTLGRVALTTGVLGGFTTYSTFNYETLRLAQQAAWGLAAANVAATVAVCLGAGVAGVAAARLVWGAG